MDTNFLDNFVLPDGAADAIKKAGMNTQRVGDGIDFFQFGNDKGVAYRFFVHQERNEAKSKIAKIGIPDSIEMIEWQVDRYQKPTERVRFLPMELLEFDTEGNCISGKFKESYDAWKKGLNAPGMSLTKWDALSSAQVFTLNELKIYSVEQFASQPRGKIDKLPAEFQEAFELAVEYVNGKSGRDMAAETASQILSVNQENAKLKITMEAQAEELKTMQQQMAALLGGKALKPRGRPKTVITEPTEGEG